MPPDALAASEVRIESFLVEEGAEAMARDVREGLAHDPKELPPKYFYDARGSELFDRITQLPEYYPTRCERALLNRYSPEIVQATGAGELVELGSGMASKTRALLYAMVGAGTLRRYVPFDVDASVVERCAGELTELYPGLSVHGVVGDFERHLGQIPPGDRRILALLGGTLGNLHPGPRHEFLVGVRELLGPEDHFLVGAGLVIDRRTLEAAYDDSAGVTAEFNRNMLLVLNDGLGANFDPEAFEHVAVWDADASRIEMRLRSLRDQRVALPGADMNVDLRAGEEIRTEISTKFTREAFAHELDAAGMRLESFFSDDARRFGLALAGPA